MVNVKAIRKIAQIFVAFSENLNFNDTQLDWDRQSQDNFNFGPSLLKFQTYGPQIAKKVYILWYQTFDIP